jgi:hypothetical protein
LERYCIALTKPRRKAIPTSFYDNIINHETKELFLRYLFHAHYIILDILIQVNEGIIVLLQNFVEIKPYTINVTNIAIHSFTCANKFTLVH